MAGKQFCCCYSKNLSKKSEGRVRSVWVVQDVLFSRKKPPPVTRKGAPHKILFGVSAAEEQERTQGNAQHDEGGGFGDGNSCKGIPHTKFIHTKICLS